MTKDNRRSLEEQKIAVLGAGGFIGRHALTALKKTGATLRAVDLVRPQNAKDTGAGWFVGDIADEAFISSAITGCDTVVFLASRSLPVSANNNMAAEIRSHVEGSVRAAEIALSQGVKRFLFASSGGTVYGTNSEIPVPEDTPKVPRNAYGVSKLSVEHYLRVMNELRGLKTLSLRISNPFGEGQQARGMQGFVAAAMEHAFSSKSLSIWGDGSVIRDFVYVGDVADAIVTGCSYDGTATEINIGSSKGRTLLEVAKAVEMAAGKPLELVFEPGRNIDVAANILDVSRARHELHWTPKTNFANALELTAQWWRARSDA